MNGRWFGLPALVVGGLLLGGGMARAASTVVRVGEHPGFGRIVFDLPPGATVDAVTEGDRVLLVFRNAGLLEAPAGLPRNVASLSLDGATATIAMTPGARLRQQRLGNRLVVDVADPKRDGRADARGSKAPGAKAAVAPTSAPASPAGATVPAAAVEAGAPGGVQSAARQPSTMAASSSMPRNGMPAVPAPVPLPVATPLPAAAPIPAPIPAPLTAPVSAVTQEALPGPAAGQGARTAPSLAGLSFLIPADASVGAAAFRRGGVGVVVLDRRMGLAVPAPAVVTPGLVSTTVQVALRDDQVMRLGRTQAGWSVEVLGRGAATGTGPASPQRTEAGLLLPVGRPGRVVAILDPASGSTLLVGTSLVAANAEAGSPGPAAGLERRTPDYALIPAWLGAVIEPLGDRVDLRPLSGGFLLTGGAALPKPGMVASPGRRFDLPDEPTPALLNRMRAQLATASAAPSRARGPARRAAAETMLALGLGVEAQAVLQQSMAEDPQAAADSVIKALSAAAAVVAWRLDETDGLDDPSLDGPGATKSSPADTADATVVDRSDDPELTLWRGVRDRRLGRATAAAAALPGLVAVALQYPEPLRRRIWPDVAEAAAEARVAVPADRATPYAKALALERTGSTDEALAAWSALAGSADRLDATRASVRAAELGLAAGRMTAAAAADALERQVFAWRGDGRELALRQRVAELRAASGAWRVALDGLRDAESLFPDQAAAIRPRKAAVFESMLAAEGGGLSPLAVVLLAADYADCLPDGEAGAALAALLADKLMALDLPARAIPVLQGVVRTTAGPARAEFGSRLAQLLLEGGDPAGAEAALAASAARDLPVGLSEARAMVAAQVRAAQGDPAGADTALRALDSARADGLRATLLARAGDWRGSLAALNDLAARVVPNQGVLDEAAQAVVIQQATAAARVPDPAALRTLAPMIPRMTAANRTLLQVLTEAPVTSTNDLARAASELKLARQLPQRL